MIQSVDTRLGVNGFHVPQGYLSLCSGAPQHPPHQIIFTAETRRRGETHFILNVFFLCALRASAVRFYYYLLCTSCRDVLVSREVWMPEVVLSRIVRVHPKSTSTVLFRVCGARYRLPQTYIMKHRPRAANAQGGAGAAEHTDVRERPSSGILVQYPG